MMFMVVFLLGISLADGAALRLSEPLTLLCRTAFVELDCLIGPPDSYGLQKIDCAGRGITSEELTKLQVCETGSISELNLEQNIITSLEGIKGIHLERLKLGHNQISDLSTLHSFEKLWELGLDSNHITNIEPLGRIVSLGDLNLENNEVRHLEPLAHLKFLEHLKLRSNKISNFPKVGLGDLLGLQELDLSGNPFDTGLDNWGHISMSLPPRLTHMCYPKEMHTVKDLGMIPPLDRFPSEITELIGGYVYRQGALFTSPFGARHQLDNCQPLRGKRQEQFNSDT